MSIRSDILEAAKVCVAGERVQDYGKPENNFSTIGKLWGTYLRALHPEVKLPRITARDVAIMMALLKVARMTTSNSLDNYIDPAGYAACAAEIDNPEA